MNELRNKTLDYKLSAVGIKELMAIKLKLNDH